MNPVVRLVRDLGAYLNSSDPRLRIAGTVVMVVGGNQPFYPAYVWWIAGGNARWALLTWLSTPFFAAVPALARRHPTAGKLLLIAAGIGNTALCAAVLGRSTGVELFYLPCLVLGVVLFERRQRRFGLVASAGPIALALATLGGPGLAGFSPAENFSLLRLHAISVACLLVVLAYSTWKALRPR